MRQNNYKTTLITLMLVIIIIIQDVSKCWTQFHTAIFSELYIVGALKEEV